MSDFIPWLRGLAEKGGKGVVNNIDARCLGRIADLIERLNKELGEAHGEVVQRQDELGRLLHAAEAKVEKLHVVAKNVSHALMSFTPGGSEYFTRLQVGDWEDYYADADACQRRVRERIDKAEEALREKYRSARIAGQQERQS